MNATPIATALSALFAALAERSAASREARACLTHVAGIIATDSAAAEATLAVLSRPPEGVSKGARNAAIRGLARAGERHAAQLPQSVGGTFCRIVDFDSAGTVAARLNSETRVQTEARVLKATAEREAKREAKRDEAENAVRAAQLAELSAMSAEEIGTLLGVKVA